MVPGCPRTSEVRTVQAFRALLAAAVCLYPGKAIRIREPTAIAEADADVDLSEINFPTSCYTEQMGFEEFCRTYGRKYQPGTAEYLFRKGLFELHTVAAQMQNCKLGSKWIAGVNKHADWTEDELASLRGYVRSSRSRRQSQSAVPGGSFLLGRRAQTSVRRASSSVSADLPESVSWYHLASIQAESDQGQCGSCWAHTAETVLRSHSEIHAAGQNFSVDELISCVPNPQECGGRGGCMGATIELAFDYVMRNGLSLERGDSDPPDEVSCPAKLEDFVAPIHEVFLEDGREVHVLGGGGQDPLSALSQDGSRDSARAHMFGWTKLPENRMEPLLRSLVELGPLAVAVAAGWQWNLYKAGIMAVEDSCQDQVITHAVVLFGYGSEDGTKYWHLKNSWGSWWGEDGFIRLQRMDNEEDHCAWDNKPEVGTGCLGGPPQVWVCGACGILYDAAVPHLRPLDIPKEAEAQDM